MASPAPTTAPVASHPPLRILIGDDHADARHRFKVMFASTSGNVAAVTVVAEASSGPDVLATVRTLGGPVALDVVLLDIALPDRDGLEVLQTLRRDWPALPVLMLSTYPEKQYAVRCIELGAAGYLNKDAGDDELLQAVRKVAGGGLYVTAAAAEALATALNHAGRQGLAALSHRELQVFHLLSAGCSVSEIGAQLGLAANTVSTYRARILDKTGTQNDAELALYAERHARAETRK